MSRLRWFCCGVMAIAMAGAGFLLWSERPALDPADVTGAAPATCWGCRDLRCDECPTPTPCRRIHGFCKQIVRNASKICVPMTNGPYEMCKFRIDDTGSCVTTLANPCLGDVAYCVAPVDGCGPLGTCIPEGVCLP